MRVHICALCTVHGGEMFRVLRALCGTAMAHHTVRWGDRCPLVISEMGAPHRTRTCMSTVNTIINPATEEAIDEFDVADVDAAVQRSAVAQRKWVNLLLSARGEALRATADTVAANLEDLANLESLNVGGDVVYLGDL